MKTPAACASLVTKNGVQRIGSKTIAKNSAGFAKKRNREKCIQSFTYPI